MNKRKIPENDPVRVDQREAIAQRRVGVGARCAICGESRPEALIPGSDPMTCVECQRKRNGHALTDKHHVAGENNSPITIEVPVNDHRAELNVAQYGWLKSTLQNPDGDPIIAIAAWLLGTADTIIYLVHKFIVAAAECLETLAEFLTNKLGPRWWIGTPLERFAPKR